MPEPAGGDGVGRAGRSWIGFVGASVFIHFFMESKQELVPEKFEVCTRAPGETRIARALPPSEALSPDNAPDAWFEPRRHSMRPGSRTETGRGSARRGAPSRSTLPGTHSSSATSSSRKRSTTC